MDLLKRLGITEEEIAASQEKERLLQEEIKAHEEAWRPWLEQHRDTVLGYRMWLRMSQMLKEINSENLLIIKPLKKNLNDIIQFSSSKYNEYKKSDYVNWCYRAIQNASPSNPIDEVWETTTGCFSAGAHGIGGKKGGSRFAAKFTTSGTYRMDIPFGLPFLLLDNTKLVIFEGFDYWKDITVDQDILDKYEEYEKGKPADDDRLPF